MLDVRRTSLCGAVLAGLLVAPAAAAVSPAAAAPPGPSVAAGPRAGAAAADASWQDGPRETTTTTDCTGTPTTLAVSRVGWFGERGVSPVTGTPYYVRVVVEGGDECGTQARIQLRLPPRTTIATSPTVPVRCWVLPADAPEWTPEPTCPANVVPGDGLEVYAIEPPDSRTWTFAPGESRQFWFPVLTSNGATADMTAELVLTTEGQEEPRSVNPSVTVPLVAGPPAVRFDQLPGSAREIDAGAGGSTWVVGTNAVPGGYGIYRWGGSGWVGGPGGAVALTVDPGGLPWVVNDVGGIYRWTGTAWLPLPGAARQIDAGADGTAWVIGTNAVPGGYGIYRWTGTGWEGAPGGAVRLSVDPAGNPWVVNGLGAVYRWNGTEWVQLPGSARDLDIGGEGTAWVLGTDDVPGGSGIYRWSGTAWVRVPGGGTRITADQAGLPWVVNGLGAVYRGVEL